MSCLLDTNILTRVADTGSPQHHVAVAAVRRLLEAGEPLHVVAQNFYEFWVVATRPREVNGLGLGVRQAAAELETVGAFAVFLPDSAAIFEHWQSLVLTHDCKGKTAHDARLVAAMRVHDIALVVDFQHRRLRPLRWYRVARSVAGHRNLANRLLSRHEARHQTRAHRRASPRNTAPKPTAAELQLTCLPALL